MSRREDYETRTEKLLQPIAAANGLSIYDVEYVKEGSGYYLRAYIDKPEGVNILDCEKVSSPGLGRVLKKDKHLQGSVGQKVEIKLFKAIEGCREFSGELEGFDGTQIRILEGDATRSFRRADIAVIRLAVDF